MALKEFMEGLHYSVEDAMEKHKNRSPSPDEYAAKYERSETCKSGQPVQSPHQPRQQSSGRAEEIPPVESAPEFASSSYNVQDTKTKRELTPKRKPLQHPAVVVVSAIAAVLSLVIVLWLQPSPVPAIGPTGPDDDGVPQYAEPISFIHDPSDRQDNEYVIAIDNSGSMIDSVDKRDAAANALIQGMPYDNRLRCTVFYFSDKDDDILQDILPMHKSDFREIISEALQENDGVEGGTDLGLMMQMAINRFSDQGIDPLTRHVLYIISDGWSDGENREDRDAKFFSLCERYRETINTYVIYVSEDNKVLQKLSDGLHTEPVELKNSSENDLDTYRNRLIKWDNSDDGNGKESAKILAIPDVNLLETALLLLQYANMDMDSTFYRIAEKDRTVSFRLPPFCTQELTIALSGGASVKDSLHELNWSGDFNNTDLLDTATVGDNPSVVTVYNEHGLPSGLYTMDILTDTKISAVFAYQNNYKIRYCLENSDDPQLPAAGSETVLQMQMLAPDGTPLPEADTPALSLRVERLGKDDAFHPYCSVNNQEKISFSGLKEGDWLRFYPVLTYKGTPNELDGFWDVHLSERPEPVIPDADETPDPSDSTTDLKRPACIAVIVVTLCILLYNLFAWVKRRRMEDKRRKEEVKKETRLTDDFICAGISWSIIKKTGFKDFHCMGGIGLRDEDGQLRKGCDLTKVMVCCLKDSSVVPQKSPLEYCLWRYTPERHCTELILKEDSKTTITIRDKENGPLCYEIQESRNSRLLFFGVNEQYPSGTVEFERHPLKVKFQLQYYKNDVPFYFKKGEH